MIMIMINLMKVIGIVVGKLMLEVIMISKIEIYKDFNNTNNDNDFTNKSNQSN